MGGSNPARFEPILKKKKKKIVSGWGLSKLGVTQKTPNGLKISNVISDAFQFFRRRNIYKSCGNIFLRDVKILPLFVTYSGRPLAIYNSLSFKFI